MSTEDSAPSDASSAESGSMSVSQEESENVRDVIRRIQALSDSERALVLQYLSHQEPSERKPSKTLQTKITSGHGALSSKDEETGHTLAEGNQISRPGLVFPILGTCDEAKLSVLGPYDEALAEICDILNSFLGTKTHASEGRILDPFIMTGLGASSSECGDSLQNQGKMIIAALHMMRANLDLMARSQNRERSEAHAGGSLAQKLEPALRELVMNESCSSNMLPASTRALIRTSALEAYTAGMKIFFRKPDDVLQVLRPLLQRVSSGDSDLLSEMERAMCTR
jgi:hypothetical protein